MYDHIASKRQWRKRNPDKVKNQNLVCKYGITYEEFLKMLKKQKHSCALCGKKETAINWRTGKARVLSVDHNHKTNKVRKLLCRRCNMVLGLIKESKEWLQTTLAYLNEEGT